MLEKIPIAFQNTSSPQIFKAVLASFMRKNKEIINRFQIIIGINNEDNQSVIDAILADIPYVRDILYADPVTGKVSFHRLLCKMLTWKTHAMIFIPDGYICRKSLAHYFDDMLAYVFFDDTIGAIYLGAENIINSKISGDRVTYKSINHSALYETSLTLQFLPFLIPTHILEGLLPLENDEIRIHKWYISEGYRTLGVKGGCFSCIK